MASFVIAVIHRDFHQQLWYNFACFIINMSFSAFNKAWGNMFSVIFQNTAKLMHKVCDKWQNA